MKRSFIAALLIVIVISILVSGCGKSKKPTKVQKSQVGITQPAVG